MKTLLLPPRLMRGSKLAVYSPSYPGPAKFPARLARGIQALESNGYEVVVTEACKRKIGFTAGNRHDRATELMRLFQDDSVNGIICSIGGYNSNEILPLLDYEIISKNPKVFVGYSDVTALLVGIYAKTSLVTFHGPAVLPEWGEYPEPQPYSIRSFQAVTHEAEAVEYDAPTAWTNEFLDWTKNEDSRPRQMKPTSGWDIMREGSGEGWLVGGNIETLNMVLGSEYAPSLEGAIVFLEATEAEAYLPRVQRSLAHLRLVNGGDKIRGLIIGRSPDAESVEDVHLKDVVQSMMVGLEIPIIMNVDFGHTDPKLTLPIGPVAKLSCTENKVTFRLLEPAVR